MTLNTMIEQIGDFFRNHGQINDVYYGSDFDFNANPNLNYKVVNYEYVDTNVNDRTAFRRFKIIIADMIDLNYPEIETEIISDCEYIAIDFDSWLRENYDWIYSESLSIQPFQDGNIDRISGVIFSISLGIIAPQNVCQIPTKN